MRPGCVTGPTTGTILDQLMPPRRQPGDGRVEVRGRRSDLEHQRERPAAVRLLAGDRGRLGVDRGMTHRILRSVVAYS